MSAPVTRCVEFVDLKAQVRSIRPELDAAIGRILDDCSFIGGGPVSAFECDFASWVGSRHCVGVANGTDALYVALWALGIGPGDEVITAANTFIATSEAITRCGAQVVFADCDAETYTLDPARVQAAITPRTKAIIPVHLYGHPADMGELQQIAARHELYLIEDAAQAHGATYEGQRAGRLGHVGCFSFYPGKNLGACGDAGAIVTDDAMLAEKMKMFANHGRLSKYDHEFEGINSRLDSLQAAILSVKLGYLDEWNARRQQIAGRYDDELADVCQTPRVRPGSSHVYHLYVVQLEQRDAVKRKLAANGVATGIHYPRALPLLAAYRHLGYSAADFPVAAGLQDTILSLPIHGSMSDEDVDWVIQQVRAASGA